VRFYDSKAELDAPRGRANCSFRIAYLNPRPARAVAHPLYDAGDDGGAGDACGGDAGAGDAGAGGAVHMTTVEAHCRDRLLDAPLATALGFAAPPGGGARPAAADFSCLAVLKAGGAAREAAWGDLACFRHYPLGACTLEVRADDGRPAKPASPPGVWPPDASDPGGAGRQLPPWARAALEAARDGGGPADGGGTSRSSDGGSGSGSGSIAPGSGHAEGGSWATPAMRRGFESLAHCLVPPKETGALAGEVTASVLKLLTGGPGPGPGPGGGGGRGGGPAGAQWGADVRMVKQGGSVAKGTHLPGR
jgi:hypothetical protein